MILTIFISNMFNKKDYIYVNIGMTLPVTMNDEKKKLLNQLSKIEQEHKDLDEVILKLQDNKMIDLFQNKS